MKDLFNDPKRRFVPLVLAGLHFCIFIACLLVFFFFEQEPKLLVIASFVMLNGILGLVYKDFLFSTLLLIIIIFPLNITLLIERFSETAFVSGKYINYLSPYLTVLDLFVFILLVSILLNTKKNLLNKGNLYIFSGIFVYFLVHWLLHFDVNVIIQSFRWFLYITTLILISECWSELLERFKKHEKIYLTVIGLAVITQLLLGLYQHSRGNYVGLEFLGESKVTAGFTEAGTVVTDGDLKLRPYGTFPHPNVYAGFFLFWIIVMLSSLKSNKREIFKYLIIFIGILGVISSYSQSAILALFFIMGVFLFWRVSKKNFKQAKFVPMLSLIPEKASIVERLGLLNSSVQYLKDNFLTGVGINNFTRYFYEYAPMDVSGMTLIQPVHNIFALLLVENGIFAGFAILGGVLYLIIKRIKNYEVNEIFIISLITILIIGNVDHYFLTLPQGNLILLSLVFFLINPFPFSKEKSY